MVFVVGTGRCGTQTLWKLFDSLPDTFSTHEGRGVAHARRTSPLRRRVALGSMLELNHYLYHQGTEADFARTFAPDPAMRALMDRCFAERAHAVSWCAKRGLAYCDANPFGYNFINYLHERYPRARFVHLVRDGYACVGSWFRREQTTYPDEVPRELSAIAWILAKPKPFPGDPAHAQWDRFDRLQKISWFWSTVNANIALRLERIPAANRLTLPIEGLDQAKARRLLDFCELPGRLAGKSLAPVEKSEGSRLDWTAANLAKFNAIAAPMMETLGYAVRVTGT